MAIQGSQYEASMTKRRRDILITFLVTLAFVLFAVCRRFYVRYRKIASNSWDFQEIIIVIATLAMCTFMGLVLRSSVVLYWNSGDLDEVYKLFYAALLFMDIMVTAVRFDFFFVIRRIHRHINQKYRTLSTFFIGLSAAYLLACIVSRTAIFAMNGGPADDRGVRLGLIIGDVVLSGSLVFMLLTTLQALRIAQRRMTKENRFLVEAARPCVPMVLTSSLSMIPALLRVKYLSALPSAGRRYADQYINGFLCAQAEVSILIIAACFPMMRTMLWPSLTLPQNHPKNMRVRYAAPTPKEKKWTPSGLYRSAVRWEFIIDESFMLSGTDETEKSNTAVKTETDNTEEDGTGPGNGQKQKDDGNKRVSLKGATTVETSAA